MTVRRLYVREDLTAGATVTLDADQSHYLVNVLRMGAGDSVALFNAAGGEWTGEIIRGEKREARILLQQQTRPRLSPLVSRLWLCFAPLKKTRTDFLVEKASELGVHVLQPIITDYTNSERVKVERLQQIAIEAAEQCDRLDVPKVLAPVTLEKLLYSLADNLGSSLSLEGEDAPLGAGEGDAKSAQNLIIRENPNSPSSGPSDHLTGCLLASSPQGRREVFSDTNIFLAAERGAAQPIAVALQNTLPAQNIIFIIGPEGGFSDAEFQLFDQYPGITRLRLGPRLLRAETAAIAALGVYQGLKGDWGPG